MIRISLGRREPSELLWHIERLGRRATVRRLLHGHRWTLLLVHDPDHRDPRKAAPGE